MVDKAKVKIYWEKSVENYRVSDTALVNHQFNASASRYYYALYLGFWAYFESKGITVPNKYYPTVPPRKIPDPSWDKRELKEKAVCELGTQITNLETLMDIALKLRVKGDYKPFPVEERELKNLRLKADKILVELDTLTIR